MPKLTRGKYIVYIDASFGTAETPQWFKIGKNLSSLSIDLSPDVTTEKNIFDETYSIDNGYSVQTSVETYYANTDDAIYAKLKDIALNRLSGDACKTKILEVMIDSFGPTGEISGENHSAWIEDVIVKPTSYGGDTSGVTIPYNIYFDGNRVEGEADYPLADYKNGSPTFQNPSNQTTGA